MYDKGKDGRVKRLQTRALLGSRFKLLLADSGMTPEDAAKVLHVTPRTVRYWISGKVTVPYAAYRLLRITRMFELPMPGWEGWHMHSGKLWTPEGFGFTPDCQSWWSLLVRQARLFRQMYQRDAQVNAALRMAGPDANGPGDSALARALDRAQAVPTGVAGRAAQPPGLDLSIGHNWEQWGISGTNVLQKRGES